MKGGRIAWTLFLVAVLGVSLLVSEDPATAVRVLRGPILIEGNENFTAANGVVGGSGTAADPYVIEGWEIPAYGENGIEIRDTDARFVVRDVVVIYVVPLAFYSFLFENVTNGRIEDVLVDSESWSFFGGVRGLTLRGNRFGGIILESSVDVLISENNISHNLFGVVLFGSTNVTLRDNTIMDNEFRAISSFSSRNLTLEGNVLTSGGLVLEGDSLADFSSHIVSRDNTVNGRPLYYYKDCAGLDVSAVPVGQLIVANCTDVRAADLEISEADAGIQMAFVDHAVIRGNDFQRNNYGGLSLHAVTNAEVIDNRFTGNNGTPVLLTNSTNVTLVANRFAQNRAGMFVMSSSGVAVRGSDVSNSGNIQFASSANVTIEGNLLTGGRVTVIGSTFVTARGNRISFGGIDVRRSKEVTIATNRVESDYFSGILLEAVQNASVEGNTLVANAEGIDLLRSTGVVVHHNNLLDNTVQAVDDLIGGNAWDDGYPSGGNYWSDYAGPDGCSGPDQDVCSGPDGLGDVPRVIVADTQDNYPLMEPFNAPPAASFVLAPEAGNVTTVFTVDASSSTDPDEPTTALQVRWDWEDDGVWDTPWTTEKTAQHRYAEPGTYTIRLEVRDTGERTNTTTAEVAVDPEVVDGPLGPAPWLIPILLILIAVPIAVLLLWLRQKGKKAASPPPTGEVVDRGDGPTSPPPPETSLEKKETLAIPGKSDATSRPSPRGSR